MVAIRRNTLARSGPMFWAGTAVKSKSVKTDGRNSDVQERVFRSGSTRMPKVETSLLGSTVDSINRAGGIHDILGAITSLAIGFQWVWTKHYAHWRIEPAIHA